MDYGRLKPEKAISNNNPVIGTPSEDPPMYDDDDGDVIPF